MRLLYVNLFKNAALTLCKLFVISGARVGYQVAASSDNEREYLTRLAQTTTNKNISEQILFAVGINGLRPDIRKIVMNKNPANIEELRHCTILAEKSAVTGDNTL
jgi:hypothetical protein